MTLDKSIAYLEYTYSGNKKIRRNQNKNNTYFTYLIHFFSHNPKLFGPNIEKFVRFLRDNQFSTCFLLLLFDFYSLRLKKLRTHFIVISCIHFDWSIYFEKKKKIYELMWSDAIKSTRQKGEQKRARACQSMRKRKKNGEKDRKGKRVHKRNLPLHVKILKTVSKYLNSFCSSWIIVY